jgi:endonuclease-3
MENVEIIFKILKTRYPLTSFEEHGDKNPFQVLISCILSLRTKDEITYPAAQRLFKVARTPKLLSKLDLVKIKELIKPVNFYITKAERIKEIARQIHEELNDKVPNSVEELMKFKGVGKKTAAVVMVFGHKSKKHIPVDIHVHVISNRLGWVNTKNADETMSQLMDILPKKYWIDINELFVRFGKDICVTVSPKCAICPINKYCKKIDVVNHR